MNIFNKKEKVAVYIDGSNFYGYLKDEEIVFSCLPIGSDVVRPPEQRPSNGLIKPFLVCWTLGFFDDKMNI